MPRRSVYELFGLGRLHLRTVAHRRRGRCLARCAERGLLVNELGEPSAEPEADQAQDGRACCNFDH